MTVLVSPEDDIEIRDVVVHNLTDTARPTSCVLPRARARRAGGRRRAPGLLQPVRRAPTPATTRCCRARPRTDRDVSMHLAHFVVPIEGVVGEVGGETDRCSSSAATATSQRRPRCCATVRRSAVAAGLDPIAAPACGSACRRRPRASCSRRRAVGRDAVGPHRCTGRRPTTARVADVGDTRGHPPARTGDRAAEYAALQALTPVCRRGGGDGGPAIPFRRQHLWRHGISATGRSRRRDQLTGSSAFCASKLRARVLRRWYRRRRRRVERSRARTQPVADAISPLVSDAGPASGAGQPPSAAFVLRPDEVSSIECFALRAWARMVFDADGRPFEHHV